MNMKKFFSRFKKKKQPSPEEIRKSVPEKLLPQYDLFVAMGATPLQALHRIITGLSKNNFMKIDGEIKWKNK